MAEGMNRASFEGLELTLMLSKIIIQAATVATKIAGTR